MNSQITEFKIQRNIATVKGFFRRPIILVSGILLLASTIIEGIVGRLVMIDSLKSIITEGLASTGLTENVDIDLSSVPTGSFSVLGILLILMFIFAKRDNNSVKIPAIIFKIYSLVSFISIIVCLVLLVIIFVAFIPFAPTAQVHGLITEIANYENLLIPFCTVTVALLVVALILSITQKNFSKSIADSMTSPELKNDGAKAFAITSFIYASIIDVFTIVFLLLLAESGVSNNVFVPFAFAMVFNVVVIVLFGIVALQYNSYIEKTIANYQDVPMDYVYEEQPEARYCNNCGFQADSDDSYCINCGKALDK